MPFREGYLDRVTAQHQRLGAEIGLLETRLDSVPPEEREERLEELRALRRRQETLRARIDSLREADTEDWEPIRSAVDSAVEDLKIAVGEAVARFPKG